MMRFLVQVAGGHGLAQLRTTQYYVVDGWVESKNSFGSMLRSKFIICYSAGGRTVTRHFLCLGSDEYGSIPVECKPAFKLAFSVGFPRREGIPQVVPNQEADLTYPASVQPYLPLRA